MRPIDAASVILAAIIVTVFYWSLLAEGQSRAEARAFGRGAIAGTCRVMLDRYPAGQDRPPEVQSALADCKPYLEELERRS